MDFVHTVKNLDEFKDLRVVLSDKKDFKFMISDHRELGYGGTKNYTIADNKFNGVYDPLRFVSIYIYRDRVELDSLLTGFKKFTYKFDQQDLDKLGNMNENEDLEYCIKSAVNKWNSYYRD